jgi:transcriptional regulator with XRE-family HTH domain
MCNKNTDYVEYNNRYCGAFIQFFPPPLNMNVHIGNKIKSIVNKNGMSVSEFGRRINKSRENVYSIFRRKSIDTALLSTISKVLDHDFFQYYTPLSAEVLKLQEEIQTLKEVLKHRQVKKKK